MPHVRQYWQLFYITETVPFSDFYGFLPSFLNNWSSGRLLQKLASLRSFRAEDNLYLLWSYQHILGSRWDHSYRLHYSSILRKFINNIKSSLNSLFHDVIPLHSELRSTLPPTDAIPLLPHTSNYPLLRFCLGLIYLMQQVTLSFIIWYKLRE